MNQKNMGSIKRGSPLLALLRVIGKRCAPAVVLVAVLATASFGGDCFVAKPSFAVREPYLIEKVCYLYAHEKRAYKPGEPEESQFSQVMGTVDLIGDPLHRDFLEMLRDGKYLPLSRGTQLFSCQYDLETIKRDRSEAQLKGYAMPEFACGGVIFEMVPVRLNNMSICYWVAEAAVRCDEQIKYKVTPFDLFEDELKPE